MDTEKDTENHAERRSDIALEPSSLLCSDSSRPRLPRLGTATAMDSRNGAAAPLPQHPHAFLAHPDLDRPPAVMEMWELEAVAAALPAKKHRLRETFDRLAACAPAPLPFLWEDLDAYISSLQYSVTLRRHQLLELDESRPAPAAVFAAPSGTGDDVRQIRALETAARPCLRADSTRRLRAGRRPQANSGPAEVRTNPCSCPSSRRRLRAGSDRRGRRERQEKEDVRPGGGGRRPRADACEGGPSGDAEVT
jgi:hypothetical protein